MKALRVRVEHGRIVSEAPANAEAASLNEALRRGFAAIGAGRFRPAADVIADLRTR